MFLNLRVDGYKCFYSAVINVVKMKVGIAGSGYVGTNTGKMMEELGNPVLYFDKNEERVTKLKSAGYEATTSAEILVNNSEVIIICVNTPTVNGRMDDSCIRDVAGRIGDYIRKGQTIVMKSTVLPTTTERIVMPKMLVKSGLCEDDFGLVSNPEFITQISSSWTSKKKFDKNDRNIGRAVIGLNELDGVAKGAMESLYRNYKGKIIYADIVTAEMSKYASNCALASRISYWNEVKGVCDAVGIDSNTVAKICGADERVGEYGTVHGKAFGGTCLPKDTEALITFAEEHEVSVPFLKAVKAVNDRTREKYGVREGDFNEKPAKRSHVDPTIVKNALYCALGAKNAYWREIMEICSNIGADYNGVVKICSMDERIGCYGTDYGTECTDPSPRFLDAMLGMAAKNDVKTPLLEAMQSVRSKCFTPNKE